MISALNTDQYTLTMAQSFWRHDQNERTSFEMFVRSLPKHRAFLVACGLETVLDFLEGFRFSPEELEFLAGNDLYDREFLDFLADLRFTGDVHAIAEGSIVGEQVPMLRVDAPRIEACIIESALLTMINHQTMIASKAARIQLAAQGRPVWDFSLRRLHGVGSCVETARAAFIGGCTGTATVEAGRKLGIPTTGTMAHHFIQSFGEENEVAAFEQFLMDYPDNGVMLIDTYDTFRGIHRAIEAAENTTRKLKAVRLDSGNLERISKYVRNALDEAGYTETQIIASNDLDEYKIEELLAADAPIDAFGVGTMLGTSADNPNLGGVYKIVAQQTDDERPDLVMKKAIGKQTDPGRHQVYRNKAFPLESDTIAMVGEDGFENCTALLDLVMENGIRTTQPADITDIKQRLTDQLEDLPLIYRNITNFSTMTAGRSNLLTTIKRELTIHEHDGPIKYRAEVINSGTR